MDAITLNLLTAALSIGITYGTLIGRIRSLEQSRNDNKRVGERIAAIEGKIDLLISLTNKTK